MERGSVVNQGLGLSGEGKVLVGISPTLETGERRWYVFAELARPPPRAPPPPPMGNFSRRCHGPSCECVREASLLVEILHLQCDFWMDGVRLDGGRAPGAA